MRIPPSTMQHEVGPLVVGCTREPEPDPGEPESGRADEHRSDGAFHAVTYPRPAGNSSDCGASPVLVRPAQRSRLGRCAAPVVGEPAALDQPPGYPGGSANVIPDGADRPLAELGADTVSGALRANM